VDTRLTTTIRRLSILTILTSALVQIQMSAQTDQAMPQPCVVQLNDTTTYYQPLLTGPPQTMSMESGLVILNPGKSGEQHSSKGYEEEIIVISGEGEMRISGGPTLKLRENTVAYCPIRTVHNIHNTGTKPLKYVYVAAKVVE